MIATLSALLLAHALADFLLQTDAMVRRKSDPVMLGVHAAIVLGTAMLAVGQALAPALWALAALHLATDLIKGRVGDTFGPFLADQAVHLAILLAVAALFPGLWAAGLWARLWPQTVEPLPAAFAILAGALLAVRGGRFAVAKYLERQSPPPRAHPAEAQRGVCTGEAERALVFLAIALGQVWALPGLLLAKAGLWHDALSRPGPGRRRLIGGTLVSFFWAIAAGCGTVWLASNARGTG